MNRHNPSTVSVPQNHVKKTYLPPVVESVIITSQHVLMGSKDLKEENVDPWANN